MAEKIKNEKENDVCPECGEEFDKSEDLISITLPKNLKGKIPKKFAETLVEEIFPSIWNDKKDELKQMSRKEVCEEMFYAGALLSLGKFLDVDSETLVSQDEELESENVWKDGVYANKMSGKEMEGKMRTFDMGHEEEMNYSCARCNAKISAHNKDWHEGLCDLCFNKEYNRGGMHIE